MLKWIKKLFLIVKHYDSDRAALSMRIQEAVNVIADRCTVNTDISPSAKGISYVILVGHYRNRDYVEVKCIRNETFKYLVDSIRSELKYGHTKYMDIPPGLKATIDTEFKL